MQVAPPRTSLLLGAKEISQLSRAQRRKFGAEIEKQLPGVNGVEISLPTDRVEEFLESLPHDAAVLDNSPLFGRETPRSHGADESRSREARFGENPGQQRYVSRPVGLEAIHESGLTGKGVTIAVIDSGHHNHPDFQDRLKFFKDFTRDEFAEPRDPFGHGTGVAGVAVGDGPEIDGVAPGADLISLRITDPSEAIEALDWVVKNKERFGIDVVNMSLGDLPMKLAPASQDLWAQATQRVIDAGMVTVAAAGNEYGKTLHGRKHLNGSINTPGYLPDVITVGGFNDNQTRFDLNDDKMFSASSRGPTIPDGHMKPDLLASGVRVWTPSAPGSVMEERRLHGQGYMLDTGSSMAVPAVAGTAALLLQANPTLSHQQIKEILMTTADPMEGVPVEAQGAGRLNLPRAIALAEASNLLA